MRLFLLTSLAMIAFAGNSLLSRVGLADGAMDAASFSAIRLVVGAGVLAVLVASMGKTREAIMSESHWLSASALFIYATAFSFAYIWLDTGLGALILFFMVQATMIGWGLATGYRPQILEWCGLAIAFVAFFVLVSPGAAAPDIIATLVMVLAGIAWGMYSLYGRKVQDPIAATAGNFIRTVPMAIIMIALMAIFGDGARLSPLGLAAAAASGALTSALGYVIWYDCLKHLTPSKAAIIQLSAPAIAAMMGVIVLGEQLSLKLILCTIAILGGIALALLAKTKNVGPIG